MILRRIRVGSAAKVIGIMYAVLGLLVGICLALVSMVSAGFMAGAESEGFPSWFGAAFGVGAIVVLPILYGVIGLLLGAIGSAVYNLVAGMVGGLHLELQPAGPGPTPPAR